jgi:hypothetical protein
MEAQALELPEKDFSFSHFYVLEGCTEAGCSSVAFLSIVVFKSIAVMAKIPDKNMMEWGMLGTTIICLLGIKAYKHMREDYTLTISDPTSDLV